MGSYRVAVKKSVAKDLRSLPNGDVARILKRIHALAQDPRPPGSSRLSAQERYRIRHGVYRIIYEVKDNELLVVVVKVGHRREVYRDS